MESDLGRFTSTLGEIGGDILKQAYDEGKKNAEFSWRNPFTYAELTVEVVCALPSALSDFDFITGFHGRQYYLFDECLDSGPWDRFDPFSTCSWDHLWSMDFSVGEFLFPGTFIVTPGIGLDVPRPEGEGGDVFFSIQFGWLW